MPNQITNMNDSHSNYYYFQEANYFIFNYNGNKNNLQQEIVNFPQDLYLDEEALIKIEFANVDAFLSGSAQKALIKIGENGYVSIDKNNIKNNLLNTYIYRLNNTLNGKTVITMHDLDPTLSSSVKPTGTFTLKSSMNVNNSESGKVYLETKPLENIPIIVENTLEALKNNHLEAPVGSIGIILSSITV